MRVWTIGAACLVAASVVVIAPPAQAAPAVQCGAVLTANAALTQDLHCASGVGLTLDGNIVLDLGGHRLTGPGAASASFTGSIGLALTETGTPRVQNGTISGWDTGTGLSLDNAGFDPVDATFLQVTYSDNNAGVVGSNSNFGIANSRFMRNSTAGISGLTTRAGVRDSLFIGNGRAISLSDGGSLILSRSVLDDNEVAVSCSEVVCTITQSYLRNNDTAIAAFLAKGKIALNDIRGNQIGFRTDFDPDPGFAHELALNLFTSNASAVIVNDLGTVYLHDNQFVTNDVGFAVPSPAFRFSAVLVRNSFTRNGDGVFVNSPGAVLKQNTATDNSRWGIRAVGGVDLGGNLASGNGNSPQCVGVICPALS